MNLARRQPLVDSNGRVFDYLRLSLTDRCNFACRYCMPPGGLQEGLSPIAPKQFLTVSEIERFVRILCEFGDFRIRLTGGEPLLRAECLEVVQVLKKIQGVHEISLTTNASLLRPLLVPLKKAGLDRLNISLDSLDPRRFAEITLRDLFTEVFAAVKEALKMNFPLKINLVALKGLSQKEIIEFVQLAIDYPLEIRFLEFMPLCGQGWQGDYFLPVQEIRQTVLDHFHCGPEDPRNQEVAQTFKLEGGRGRVGFIAPVSEPFCENCTRLRLTADGRIRPCLFSNREVAIGSLLRQGAQDAEIRQALIQAAILKPPGSFYYEKPWQGANDSSVQPQATPFIRSIGG